MLEGYAVCRSGLPVVDACYLICGVSVVSVAKMKSARHADSIIVLVVGSSLAFLISVRARDGSALIVLVML